MFSNPVKPDKNIDEASVIQVDSEGLVCKVVTMMGQRFDSVPWLTSYGGNDRGGDRGTPRMGDRVVLNYGLGYPVIIGFLPRQQSTTQVFPVGIDTGKRLVNTGNYLPGAGGTTTDASKPADMLIGDRTWTSLGGGLIGLLRAGSVVIRSSRAAEIFMSRIGDVVRIVSRNFEHFTDVSSDVVKNFRGRVYRYKGFTHTFAKAKIEDYNYHQYYGDTTVAEAVKTNYLSPPTAIADTNLVIFKEQITSQARAELMRRTVDLEGTQEVYITDGGQFTRMRATNGVLTFSYGDQHTITIDSGKINIHHGGGADILLNSEGITSTFSGGTVKMHSGGITSEYSGGKVDMSGSGVNTTFSRHFCNVTAGGVALG